MKKLKYILIGTILLTMIGIFLFLLPNLPKNKVDTLGTDVIPFTSKQLAVSPVSTYCLTTDGAKNSWSSSCGSGGGGGGSSSEINWTWFNGSGVRVSTTSNQVLIGATATTSTSYPLSKLIVVGNTSFGGNSTTTGILSSDTKIVAPIYEATSTTATSTFQGGFKAGSLFEVQSGSGRVAIGTTTPGAGRLWITNTGIANQLNFEDTSAIANQHYAGFSYSRGNFYLNTMDDLFASTTRFRLNQAGNLAVDYASTTALSFETAYGTGGGAGLLDLTEGTCSGATSVHGIICADSASHKLMFSGNGGAFWYASASSTLMADINTYTGLNIFGTASTTNLSVSGSLYVPNGTAPSIPITPAGQVVIDTTSGQFKWSDGQKVQVITGTSSPSVNIASTTLDVFGKTISTGTTTLLIANRPEPFTLAGFYCTATSTVTVVPALIRFGDNSNWTEAGTCSYPGTFTRTSTNNTFTTFEDFVVQASSTSGTVGRMTITTVMNKTAD